MASSKFEGFSNEGKFQEALEDAINNALTSTGVADEGVTWTFRYLAGRNGTLAGLTELTVTIEAEFDSQPK